MTNKIATTMAMGAMVVLMGCASAAPKVAALGTVGSCSKVGAGLTGNGTLTVHSARRIPNLDPKGNVQEWFPDGNYEALYELAHTDYRIYSADGQLFKQVRNARGMNDAKPTAVSLPPGAYTIEAEAERKGDLEALSVVVPVVIDPGLVTTVHLEPKWRPRDARDSGDELVLLPDGRIIGWRARDVSPAVAASH
jgi:hypothetical protein